MTLRSLCLSLVVAAAAWTSCVGGAAACSISRPESAAAHLSKADVLFVGYAIDTKRIVSKGERLMETRFWVVRTIKGKAQMYRTVRYRVGGICDFGPLYEAGKRYEVLGYASGPQPYLYRGILFFPLHDYTRAARGMRRR
ncbi:MAG: hypothetical protein K0R83_1503 [Caulobacter sp.]|jgi:hypothetical protein|nr:hypothetical protein [Caulobacter sp.]